MNNDRFPNRTGSPALVRRPRCPRCHAVDAVDSLAYRHPEARTRPHSPWLGLQPVTTSNTALAHHPSSGRRRVIVTTALRHGRVTARPRSFPAKSCARLPHGFGNRPITAELAPLALIIDLDSSTTTTNNSGGRPTSTTSEIVDSCAQRFHNSTPCGGTSASG